MPVMPKLEITIIMATSVIVIGDLHFKDNNLLELDLATRSILDLVSQINADFIVVLGDTLDQHETINSTAQTAACYFLHRLSSIKKVYLLIGNHDLRNNKEFLSDIHPFASMKGWPSERIAVIDTTVIHEIKGNVFTFVPYVPKTRFIEALDRGTKSYGVDWRRSKCIFAHQEFKGCQMENIRSTGGDSWSSDLPPVISGHIHQHQILPNGVFYTGTPIQHKYEDSDDKGIYLFSFEPKGSYNYRLIPLATIKKRIVHLDAEQILYDLGLDSTYRLSSSRSFDSNRSLGQNLDLTRYIPEGYDVKIKITGTTDQINYLKVKSREMKQKVKIAWLTNHKQQEPSINRFQASRNQPLSITENSFSALLMDRIRDRPDLVNRYYSLVNI